MARKPATTKTRRPAPASNHFRSLSIETCIVNRLFYLLIPSPGPSVLARRKDLYTIEMADQLYLSLWFPNFRFEALPAALVSVLRQFALVSGEKRVAAASVYPISFTESPVYQRIYVNDDRAQSTEDSIIENAVAEATQQLHDD